MIGWLRLLLWEHGRKVLEHRVELALVECRALQAELITHESRRPGRQRSSAAVTHKLWRTDASDRA